MNLQKKLSDNLVLHYVDANKWDHDDDGNEITTMYELSCSFYGKHYMAYASRESVDKNQGYITAEGDSELFDSFENAMEDKHWEDVVKYCKVFEEWKESL